MNRSTTLLVIAIALGIYGLYAASYVPGMLIAMSLPILLAGFLLQAVLAFASALGVWQDSRWVKGVVVLLGVAIAATWLVEAFVLGLIAYLPALAVAVVAVLATLGIAGYVGASRPK